MNTDLVIGIETDLKKISKQLKELKGGFSDSGKSAKSSFTKMSKSLNLFNKELKSLTTDGNRANKILKGLGSNTRLFGGALKMLSFAAITNFLADATKNAIGAIETQNLFAVSLGSSAKEANEFAETLSKTTGMNVASLQDAMGTYALLAKSMGMAADEAKKLAQNTTMLAIDLASLTNVPVEQVLSDLRSGLVGQSETVYKYGLDLTEAGLQEEMFALGLSGTARNLNQGSKMMLRHSKMVRVLTGELEGGGKVLGDFTRTIMQPANQLKVLQEKIMSLSIAIGNAFLPVLAKVLPYLIAFVEILIDVANALAQLFGYNAEEFGTIFSDSPSLDPIVDSAEEATGAIGGTSAAMKKLKKSLLGIDELNIMSAPKDDSASGGGGGGGIITDRDITDMIKLPDLSSFYDTITESSKELKEKMIPHLKKVAIILAIILGTLVLFKTATGIITIYDTFVKLKAILGGGLLLKLGGVALIIGGIITAFTALKDIFVDNEISVGNLVKAFVGLLAVGAGIALLVGGLPGLIAGLIAVAIGVKATVVALIIKYRQEILDFLKGIIKKAGEVLSDFFDFIYGIAEGIATSIKDKISAVIDTIKTILGMTPEEVAYALGHIIGDIIKWGADLLANGLTAANDFKNGVVTKFNELLTSAKSKFSEIKDSVVSTLTNLPNNISVALSMLKTKIGTTWTTIKTDGVAKLKEFGKSAVEFFRDLPNDIATHLTRLKEKITNLPKELKSWFSTHINELLNIGAQIMNGIISGLGDIVSKAKSIGASFVRGLKDALGIASPSKVMRDEVGIFMGLGIADGMKDATSSIVNVSTGLADKIQSEFDTVTGVDSNSLIPTDLGKFNVGEAVLKTSLANSNTNTPKGGIMNEFHSIISASTDNNNGGGEQTINLYIDGVYQGTINSVERKNTRAGKTVFSIGGT